MSHAITPNGVRRPMSRNSKTHAVAANGAHWGANACQTVLESVSAAMSVCGRSRGAKTAKTRRCLGHVGLSAPKFKRHPWVPNLGGWAQWVPGARFLVLRKSLEDLATFWGRSRPRPQMGSRGPPREPWGGRDFCREKSKQVFSRTKIAQRIHSRCRIWHQSTSF